MNIIFVVNNFKAQEGTIKIIESVLSEFCSCFQINSDNIRIVYIPDDENYENCIKSVDSSESYTLNGDNIGIAKSITKIEGLRYSHYLFFNSRVINSFFEGLNLGTEINEWSIPQQMSRYILTHELAHCKDNEMRSVGNSLVKPKINIEKFRISNIKNYYYPILLSEFSACAFSSLYITDSYLYYEIHEFRNLVLSIVTRIDQRKNRYSSNPDQNELRSLAYESAQCFWLILIQFSKLVGYTINRSKSDFITSILKEMNFDEITINVSFEIELRKSWILYPDYNEKLTKILYNIWYELAKKKGYKFKKGIFADGLFFV